MRCSACNSTAKYQCEKCDTPYCSQECQNVGWENDKCRIAGEPQGLISDFAAGPEISHNIRDLEFNTRNEDRLINAMPVNTFFWRMPSHRPGVKPTGHMVFVRKDENGEIRRIRVFWVPDKSIDRGHYKCIDTEQVGPLRTVAEAKNFDLDVLIKQFAFAPLIGNSDDKISYDLSDINH